MSTILVEFNIHYCYRFQLIPFLDDSGPTLYVNTASSLTIKQLAPVLAVAHRRTSSADSSEVTVLPRMTASEMQTRGIFQGNIFI